MHAARVSVACAAAALVCASAPTRASSDALVVIYPGEGAEIGAVTASFALGSAPPGSTVTVNGVPALIAPDGGWTVYVPFAPGRFVLHVRASNGAWSQSLDRTIDVDSGAIAAYPADTTIVQPSESIQLAVTAPAGATVTADGPGFSRIALSPHPDLGPGAYAATIAAPSTPGGPARVTYHIAVAGVAQPDVQSANTLEIASHPVLYVADVIRYAPGRDAGMRPYAMLSPSLTADTDLTLPERTQLAVTGRFDDQLRVAMPGLAPEFVGLPATRPEPGSRTLPEARIVAVKRSDEPKDTKFVIDLVGARPAFRVVENENAGGAVFIYGAGPAAAAHGITFKLAQHAFYGYRSRWTGGDLVLTFRKPPAFGKRPHAALSGLLIVVDPGHSPDTGAIGDIGTQERVVNLDISKRLTALLRGIGARVVMTRTTSKPVLLYDRPALAERIGADLLISVHNNAPPDGINPATFHGYSVYYYQPHSFALAQSIHDAYRERIGIPDNGLHKGDLALVRTSEMPSVLTESAFITWPWEEIRLRDPSFRQKLAATMAFGMERWAERMRNLESQH